MINSMLPLPGLSPASGKSVVAKFDGGLLSSDGGVLMLREVEQRLRVADRLAGCIEDQRAPDQITHAAGYEDLRMGRAWSTCIAPRSSRFPNASCWISTT